MMNLYAVRFQETNEPVGFFWVRDLLDLCDAIDSVCDPCDCEIKKINKTAAIVWWEPPTNWQMGVDIPGDPDTGEWSHEPARGADFTSDFALWDFVGGETVSGWKRPWHPDPDPSPDTPEKIIALQKKAEASNVVKLARRG